MDKALVYKIMTDEKTMTDFDRDGALNEMKRQAKLPDLTERQARTILSNIVFLLEADK